MLVRSLKATEGSLQLVPLQNRHCPRFCAFILGGERFGISELRFQCQSEMCFSGDDSLILEAASMEQSPGLMVLMQNSQFIVLLVMDIHRSHMSQPQTMDRPFKGEKMLQTLEGVFCPDGNRRPWED